MCSFFLKKKTTWDFLNYFFPQDKLLTATQQLKSQSSNAQKLLWSQIKQQLFIHFFYVMVLSEEPQVLTMQ